MECKLSEIAEIKTGVPEKSKEQGMGLPELPGIKMKNIDHKAASLDWNEVEMITADVSDTHLLKEDDIIMVGKGENNTAVRIGTLERHAVATNHFFVITVRSNQVLPEYLAWYLNNSAKQYFSLHATGTVIRNLRKEVIANLPIQVPPRKVQETVINIWNNMIKEQQVFEGLQQDRKALLTTLINDYAN